MKALGELSSAMLSNVFFFYCSFDLMYPLNLCVNVSDNYVNL